MNFVQQPLTFDCGNDWLVAIVSRPRAPRPRGVLIVVGGPQYRAGSHRQFALLANHLAEQGTPAMRFDYGGMGDSTGKQKNFEKTGQDLRAAIDAFFAAVPVLREVVIWGLCDAASAALFYAHREPRVSGLILLNPWVRTAGGQAQAYLRHYYLRRLVNPALWRKLCRGEFDFRGSVASLAKNVWRALDVNPATKTNDADKGATSAADRAQPLPERTAKGLASFNGRVLLILSGNDLTAKEFIDVSAASRRWRKLLAAPRVTQHVLADATHTFSRREWRDQVANWTAEWVMSW